MVLKMVNTVVPLLILNGSVGVGKSTIGEEVSVLLARRGINHTFVDLDALAQTFPRPSDDPYGDRLALQNLKDVWVNCYRAGSRNLVVARVVEEQSDVECIQNVIKNNKLTICLLRANDETLLSRVRKREVGSVLAWHEQRTIELARSLAKSAPRDLIIDTDGQSPTNIAHQIVDQVQWWV